MTREDKLERAAEILRDHYAVYPYEAAEAIVNTLTGPDVGMWGKFWNRSEYESFCGKLIDYDMDAVCPFKCGIGWFRNFRPIPGLKEFIEEAEK